MTTEALQLRHAVIQRIRRQMISPRFQLWMRADTIQQTDPLASPDTDAPKVLYWRNMMLLGSVLAPEPVATTDAVTGHDITPAFYLDDPGVRNLIRTELLIDPRAFLHNCHVASWAFVMNRPGAPLGTSHLPRRFLPGGQGRRFRVGRDQGAMALGEGRGGFNGSLRRGGAARFRVRVRLDAVHRHRPLVPYSRNHMSHRSYVFTRCADLYIVEHDDGRIEFEVVMTEKRSHRYPGGRTVTTAADIPVRALLKAWRLFHEDGRPEPTTETG